MIDYSCNYTSRESGGKGTCHPSVEDEWVSQRIGHQKLGTHSTSPSTQGVRHTQGQSGPTPIRDNTKDPNPLGGVHLFSTTPHPPSDFGAPKGSHTSTTVGRCGVSDPVQQLVYIRQNGRTLDHRLKQHRRALISGNVQQSAVAEHASNEMHDIDWEKAEVVDCHPHYCQRCALEAWHIRTEPYTMNRDGGPLPTVYNPLIQHPRRPC